MKKERRKEEGRRRKKEEEKRKKEGEGIGDILLCTRKVFLRFFHVCCFDGHLSKSSEGPGNHPYFKSFQFQLTNFLLCVINQTVCRHLHRV